MFTVIIPTLGISPVLGKSLDSIAASSFVGEIILINNGTTPLPMGGGKCRVVNNEENIYVNPSWNLGVELAGHDRIALCNDDILFDNSVFEWVHPLVRRRRGLIGLSESAAKVVKDDAPCIGRNRYRLRRIGWRPIGYGMLMFLHRDNYLKIPDDLKIWCGDDYLFVNQRHPNFAIGGIVLKGRVSLSSGRGEFGTIRTADRAAFLSKYKHRPLNRSLLRSAVSFMVRRLRRVSAGAGT